MQNTQDRFDPVREIYNTLSKFEVSVKDEEVQMLTNIDAAFEEFTSFITDSEKLLEKSKVTYFKLIKYHISDQTNFIRCP